MQVEERTVAFRGHGTWTRTTEPDEPSPGSLPVVVLHGGPGMAHDYVENLAELARDGRRVVHYDQLGCGRSTHLPDAPADFWTPALFVEEFAAVVADLGLERYHVVGQSWGGMLAAEIALTHPAGLASISILNSPASMELWVRGAESLRRRLPAEVREALESHEAAGTIEDPEYLAAVDVFYARHLCRLPEPPAALTATLAQTEADPTVYRTMNGPNEFFVTGSLRDWSVVDRLTEIDVPALVLAGEFDEAVPSSWAPFAESIPDVRTHLEPDASHCTHLEHPEAVLDVVGRFLRRADDVPRG